MECVEPDYHRQSPDELWDESVVHQVVGVDMAPHFVRRALTPVNGHDIGLEPNSLAVLEGALLDDLVDALERSAAHEQYVVRANLEEVLVGVLPPALRWDVSDAALDDLEQRLLHALTGDVASNRRVRALSSYLVDLVDVDDTVLGTSDVEVRRLYESEKYVLYVFANVPGLSQRGRVRYCERHFQDVGQVLRQVGLARA